jgi:hypothetical protein
MSSGEVIFKGIVEVYNASTRANAIREYRFPCPKIESIKDRRRLR